MCEFGVKIITERQSILYFDILENLNLAYFLMF